MSEAVIGSGEILGSRYVKPAFARIGSGDRTIWPCTAVTASSRTASAVVPIKGCGIGGIGQADSDGFCRRAALVIIDGDGDAFNPLPPWLAVPILPSPSGVGTVKP